MLYIFHILLLFIVDLSHLHATECNKAFDDLTFSTNRTICRPLNKDNLPEIQAIEASDTSYVSIVTNNTEKFLQNTGKIHTKSDMIKMLKKGNDLYYGVFLKSTHQLIGVYLIHPYFNTRTLYTSAKFLKDQQNCGYGTESKIGLLKHWQHLNLIPYDSKNKSNAHFLAFEAQIYLYNSASLKYNILKCDYKIGSLRGAEVRVFYPVVVQIGNQDIELHDQISSDFTQYLSRDSSEAERTESQKKLEFYSLNNILNDKNKFNKFLFNNMYFVISVLNKSLELLDNRPRRNLKKIRSLLKKEIDNVKLTNSAMPGLRFYYLEKERVNNFEYEEILKKIISKIDEILPERSFCTIQ